MEYKPTATKNGYEGSAAEELDAAWGNALFLANLCHAGMLENVYNNGDMTTWKGAYTSRLKEAVEREAHPYDGITIADLTHALSLAEGDWHKPSTVSRLNEFHLAKRGGPQEQDTITKRTYRKYLYGSNTGISPRTD